MQPLSNPSLDFTEKVINVFSEPIKGKSSVFCTESVFRWQMGFAWDSRTVGGVWHKRKMHLLPAPPPTDAQLQPMTMSHDMMGDRYICKFS